MRLTRTEPAGEVARDRASHDVWGGGLPVDAHLAREQALRDTDWSRRTRTAWSWVSEDGATLASCETYALAARWRGQACVVWAVASVFTAPAWRGAGHATALLSALAERADASGAPMVLFSDIDPGFYLRLGYVAQPKVDRVWSVGGPATGFATGATGAVLAPSGDALQIRVDPGQVMWHRLGVGWPSPHPSTGCRIGDSGLTWTPAGATLRLLDAALGRDAAACVAAAHTEAHRLGLIEIRAWETPAWPADLGARQPRAGAVPMVRWPNGSSGEWPSIPWSLWV